MAVTYLCGLETQNSNAERAGTIQQTASISTAQAYTGVASLRTNPASGANGFYNPVSSGNYPHARLYVATLPSVDRIIMGQIGAGAINVRLTSTGALKVYLNTTLIGTATVVLLTGVWYWIGIRQVTGTSVVFLQVDGADQVSGTATVSSVNCTWGPSNSEASAIDLYWDDLIVDDTGFLPPSRVALLRPISDNARAALWTGGVGGTTNLFNAVDNTPPIGTATETDSSQIEHAGSGGSADAYDANMTRYVDAGLSIWDTILAIDYFIVCGEDIATGTKLLNFLIVSNPNQGISGISNFDVFPASGALGTYPTNWTTKYNLLLTPPFASTINPAVSPVMRVHRPETASRVASVALMGMYVAFTPGSRNSVRTVRQSVPRAASY